MWGDSAESVKRKAGSKINYIISVLVLVFLLMPISGATILNITASEDAPVYSPTPGTNYGTLNPISIHNWSTTIDIAYLKFDVSSVPPDAIITDVKFFFYETDYGSSAYKKNISIFKVTEPWTETAITYNTMPADDGVILDTRLVGGYYDYEEQGWYNWTITDLASSWINGTSDNNGVKLAHPEQAANEYWFETREGTHLPYLSIDYAPRVETLAPTNVDTDSATLNATVTNHTGTDDIWFEYGSISGIYHYVTKKQSITGNGTVSFKLSDGYPIIPDKTYYYRAAIASESGNQMTFTTLDISQLSGYDFDKNWEALKNASFEMDSLAVILPLPFTDILGAIFWGIVFSLIFIIGWIRQGDVTNMALLGILIAGSILAFVPPEFVQIGQALLVVSIAGMLVSYIYKK